MNLDTVESRQKGWIPAQDVVIKITTGVVFFTCDFSSNVVIYSILGLLNLFSMCLVKPLRNKQSNSYLLDVGCFFSLPILHCCHVAVKFVRCSECFTGKFNEQVFFWQCNHS